MGKKGKAKVYLIPQYHGGYVDRGGKKYSEQEANTLLAEGKASLAKWHGNKKNPNKTSYEGTQYTGGRVEGRKNLKKVDGGFVNQHGVQFTVEEKKALERAANKVNAKRKRQLTAEGKLPRLSGGKDTGMTVSTLQVMGKESDFILARKSKSLQQFKSKADFEKYMKNLDYVVSDRYIDDRTRLYKRNHMRAIENVFGDEAKDVLMKIRMLPIAEYRELLQKEEMLEVNYVYDPSARQGKLNQIRASLGMKLKEDYYEDE